MLISLLKLKSFVEIADICNGYITASATALYIVESTLSKQGYLRTRCKREYVVFVLRSTMPSLAASFESSM